MAFIAGVGLTPFGRQPGTDALGWQTQSARQALADAGRTTRDVDALLVGYATTMHHLMPANLLAEYMGIQPQISLGVNVGGATGLAMLAQAVHLIDSGAASTVLIAAGEDRASGQTSDSAIKTLAQVGHAKYEVPLGANIPSYYALAASEYLEKYGLEPRDIAPLAVQMRNNALKHVGAQFSKPITVVDVVGSPVVANPLRLLDCCPLSDGGAAVVVTRVRTSDRDIEISGLGKANLHQHISEADFDNFGARISSAEALNQAGITIDDVGVFGVYDSFTVTLAILLEEIGVAAPGEAGAMAANGDFAFDGRYPLNLHGGLLSYGHPGVAGGMAHLIEVTTQMRREAGERQTPGTPEWGFVHADGGVLSAHVSVVLRQETAAMKGS